MVTMQVWVLSDENVYGALKQAIGRSELSLAVSEEQHSLGFRTLLIKKDEVPAWGLLLVSTVSEQIIFQSIQWIHKSWQVSDFLNFDAVTGLLPDGFEGKDYLTAVPKRCLRSAGRGDLQTGPLLYEALAFSESIQLSVVEQFASDSAALIDPQLNIFSGFGLDHDIHFERTISEHVQCFGWDNVSGEVLQSCRRLAVRAGALYVVAPRHEYRLGALDAFLRVNRGAIFGPLR